jgi:hypothetical protein
MAWRLRCWLVPWPADPVGRGPLRCCLSSPQDRCRPSAHRSSRRFGQADRQVRIHRVAAGVQALLPLADQRDFGPEHPSVTHTTNTSQGNCHGLGRRAFQYSHPGDDHHLVTAVPGRYADRVDRTRRCTSAWPPCEASLRITPSPGCRTVPRGARHPAGEPETAYSGFPALPGMSTTSEETGTSADGCSNARRPGRPLSLVDNQRARCR